MSTSAPAPDNHDATPTGSRDLSDLLATLAALLLLAPLATLAPLAMIAGGAVVAIVVQARKHRHPAGRSEVRHVR